MQCEIHLNTFWYTIKRYWIFIKISIISQSDTCTWKHLFSCQQHLISGFWIAKSNGMFPCSKQQELSKFLISNTSVLFCTRFDGTLEVCIINIIKLNINVIILQNFKFILKVLLSQKHFKLLLSTYP